LSVRNKPPQKLPHRPPRQPQKPLQPLQQ